MSSPIHHQLLANRLRYQGRKFTYRVDRLRLPHGPEGEYEYLEHPGAAMAVPVLPDGRLVLVRQYRFAIARYLLEFPAGTLEPGEHPDTTIGRELEEETGFRAQRWQKLGAFYLCPGYSDESIHAYLALDLELLPHPPAPDADEELAVVFHTVAEVASLIRQPEGTMGIDAKSVTAFYLALPFLATQP